MNKLNMHTQNQVDVNIRRIGELFPNALTERKNEKGEVERAIDFDVLRQELSQVLVEGPQERYQFTWPDKRKAQLLANAPISDTLRPCREESVDFDSTENLYIEGDNLNVLKLLQETYLGKVKMIYIDPPYNTKNDSFVYDDDYDMHLSEFANASGQFDQDGNLIFDIRINNETNGRFHTDWLNMLYPRLKVARDLLTDDGVIFINIDENEIVNLSKICSEIFGERNELGTIVWDKRNPKGATKGISYHHEYIVCYAKSIDGFAAKNRLLRPKKNAKEIIRKANSLFQKISTKYTIESANREFSEWLRTQKHFTGGERAYNAIDSNGKVFQAVSMAAPDKPETRSHRPLMHPVTKKACPVPEKGWRFTDKSMDLLLQKGEIVFGENETTQPRRKYLLDENIFEQLPSLLYYGGSDQAMLESIGIPFDTPKVVEIVSEHIYSVIRTDGIVLDFFSGSATTAHAVMQLNAEDGGKRKFIMVQLPEETNEKSEAYKAGYKNICEIGKERIRRAGAKIKEEHEKQNQQLKLGEEPKALPDTGFRVLKLASSNMKDVYYAPQDYTQARIDDLIDNIKDDRTPQDLLFQVMLELGVLLSSPIVESDIGGQRVFSVAGGFLMACFDSKINEETITHIAKQKPHYAVFRDSGYASDSVAVNFDQIFRAYSPDTVRRVL